MSNQRYAVLPIGQARCQQNRLSPLLQSLLQQAIKETYLTNVRAPITHVVNAFHHLIATENATRAPEEHLKTLGKMTVYHAIGQLDAVVTDTARLGRAQTRRILYLDGVHFTVRHGEKTDSTIILTALSVDLEGTKEVLALRACAEESQDG